MYIHTSFFLLYAHVAFHLFKSYSLPCNSGSSNGIKQERGTDAISLSGIPVSVVTSNQDRSTAGTDLYCQQRAPSAGMLYEAACAGPTHAFIVSADYAYFTIYLLFASICTAVSCFYYLWHATPVCPVDNPYLANACQFLFLGTEN